MKKILAIAKRDFDRNFNDEFIEKHDNACFISILDVDSKDLRYKTSANNFLQIKLWDIESDIHEKGRLKYEKPSDSELKRVIIFINENNDKSNFIIHCSAGISRSGAVARFLHEKFMEESPKEIFWRNNKFIKPNLYILKRLKQLDEIFIEKQSFE